MTDGCVFRWEAKGIKTHRMEHFVTLHPFDDGNGRIARALADKVLAQEEKSKVRFYSLSSQIGQEHSSYLYQFEKINQGDMEITDWLIWFIGCFGRALEGAEQSLAILSK